MRELKVAVLWEGEQKEDAWIEVSTVGRSEVVSDLAISVSHSDSSSRTCLNVISAQKFEIVNLSTQVVVRSMRKKLTDNDQIQSHE